MRRLVSSVLALGVALAAEAHVTPNVSLVRRGDFVKESLPGASKFFEKTLGPPAIARVRDATGWTPSGEDARVYVGRDDHGLLIGSVVFLWMPSQHGPVGLGVAFGPDGTALRATVTDVGTEPLAWVRPLLHDGGLAGVAGLPPSTAPDPSRIAAGSAGNMTRYFARVLADGIARCQAIAKASGETAGR